MSLAAQRAAKESLRRDSQNENARPVDPFRPMVSIRLEYQLPPVSPLNDRDHWVLTHGDLAEMTRSELEDEALRLRMTLAFGDLRRPVWAREWLQERVNRCITLLRK